MKFQNNPQHLRILTNEWLATKLADFFGLSVPACVIVDVEKSFIEDNSDLKIDFGNRLEPCTTGRQFGSRLVGGLLPGKTVDYLPEEHLLSVSNIREFAGVLAFDKWTSNSDGRQAVFSKKSYRHKHYRATFIDQGYCFNAGEWQLIDAPGRGAYARSSVYRTITGWNDFEPWLTRIEEVSVDKIWSIAQSVPQEWYGHESESLERVVEQLDRHRSRVRERIIQFGESSRNPFPMWN